MKDLAAALRSLKERFDREGIPFAVIGAMAVRRHGHMRFTEDIDLLTTKEGLEKIHAQFGGRGINPRAAGLRKKLYESEHEVNLDVITAGEPAGGAGSPVVYPDPTGEGFTPFDGVRYPTLEKLIEFKLASHLWGNRLQDLADVIHLVKANRLAAGFGEKLHPAVRAKFTEAVGMAARERDIE